MVRGLGWYLKRIRVMTPAEVAWRLLEAIRLKTWEAAFRTGALGRGYAHDDPTAFRFCTDPEPSAPARALYARCARRRDRVLADGRLAGAGVRLVMDTRRRGLAPGAGYGARLASGLLRENRLQTGQSVRRCTGGVGAVQASAARHAGADCSAARRCARARRRSDRQAIAVLACGLIQWLAAFIMSRPWSAGCGSSRSVSPWISSGGRSSTVPPCGGARRRIVHSHADLIARRLSLHSSSGNHTIAECAGLDLRGRFVPGDARCCRLV